MGSAPEPRVHYGTDSPANSVGRSKIERPPHEVHPGGSAMTLSLTELVLLIVIAAICGAVGKALAGGARGGLIVSTALGFIGALIGPWIAHQLGLGEPFTVAIGGHAFPILWSIIGAALFVALLHLISRR